MIPDCATSYEMAYFELLSLRYNKSCAFRKRFNKHFITVFYDRVVEHVLNTWATTSRISLCL